MGRSPCCEKMGLKKGPWTPDEDHILISYVHLHGHSNWRALPKQAGLLRCGKSCRLRWINYLRPGIKRGNFTTDEEDTIIKLHHLLGNRWSTIAANLPGRTDNEIKNVWHTHLKKRLTKFTSDSVTDTTGGLAVEPTKKGVQKLKAEKKDMASKKSKSQRHMKYIDVKKEENNNDNDNIGASSPTSPILKELVSSQPCTSEMSTVTSTSTSENDNLGKENVGDKGDNFGNLTEINDDFWMEVLSVEDTAMSSEDLSYVSQYDQNTSSDPLLAGPMFESNSMVNGDDMDYFWHNLLTKSNELPELLEML